MITAVLKGLNLLPFQAVDLLVNAQSAAVSPAWKYWPWLKRAISSRLCLALTNSSAAKPVPSAAPAGSWMV